MKSVIRVPSLVAVLALAAGGCTTPTPARVDRDPDVEAKLNDLQQRVGTLEQGLYPPVVNPVTTPPTCEEYEFIFK